MGSRSPLGRFDSAPSPITGHPLRYFTPYDLHELLSDLPAQPKMASLNCAEMYQQGWCQILASCCSVYNYGLSVDEEQAVRWIKLESQAWCPRNTEDMLSLGRTLSPKIKGFRSFMAYTGGSTPSTADHIYAPASALSDLMDALVVFLNEDCQRYDSIALVAMVDFYCVHMHPFVDANGRWARLIALSAAKKTLNERRALLATAFVSFCKHEIVEYLYPVARLGGSVRYIEVADLFVSFLEKSPAMGSVFNVASEINRLLCRAVTNRSASREILAALYARSFIPVSWVREVGGLSKRSAEGLFHRISDSGNGFAIVDMQSLSIRLLQQQAIGALQAARSHAFQTGGF